MLTREMKQKLETVARRMRRDIIEMIGPGKTGHFGGSLSAADIIAALYCYAMRYDAPDFDWAKRDKFIISKGHSVPAQYAALVHCGIIERAEYARFKTIGGMLQGHPDHSRTPGIEANTGSLGQGLSIGCGFALANRLDKSNARVYVLLGDGELCEGQVWEAAMAADNFGLSNLTAILDCNGLCATGALAERFKQERLRDKWLAFGWHVIEANGHDFDSICGALDEAAEVAGKPSMIIAKTIKGKGLPFAENVAAFHNGMLSEKQYQEALERFA